MRSATRGACQAMRLPPAGERCRLEGRRAEERLLSSGGHVLRPMLASVSPRPARCSLCSYLHPAPRSPHSPRSAHSGAQGCPCLWWFLFLH